MQQDTFFYEKNLRVTRLRALLSNSMKYLVQVGNRERAKIKGHSDPFTYYGLYIGFYVETHKIYCPDSDEREHSPAAFMQLMTAPEYDDYLSEKVQATIHEALYLASIIKRKPMHSLNEYFVGEDSLDAKPENISFEDFVSNQAEKFGLEIDECFLSSEDDFSILSELQ